MKQLEGRPFALLGLYVNDYAPEKLKAVMAKEKLNWRSFSSRAVAAKWCARGTPTYYLIDARGVIRSKWTGYPGVKAIDEALEALLKEVEGRAKNTP